MKTTVMGAAVGYKPEQIEKFLRTLKQTNPAAECILFVNEELRSYVESFGYEVRVPSDGPTAWSHANRFFWMLEEIRSGRLSSSKLLLTDTRDVFFQGPLTRIDCWGLNAYAECPTMTIGKCPYNSEWIKAGYGTDMLRVLYNEPILCGGTLSGDSETLEWYLEKLCAELNVCQPRCGLPQDQSCHNVLARMFGGHIFGAFEGGVATVGYFKPEELAIVDGQLLQVGSKMQAPSVVHQLDRFPNLWGQI